MTRVSSDIIKIVFHFLGSGARFPTDIPGLCRFFYRISRDGRYKELMANIIFDDSQSYPMCDTIERCAIDRLQRSGLLACIGPGLKEYEVSEALAEDREDLELFSDEEIRQMKEIAELFREEFMGRKKTVADYHNEQIRKAAAIMRGDQIEMEGDKDASEPSRRAEELEAIGRDSVNAVLEEG